jgi:hypothetical protein
MRLRGAAAIRCFVDLTGHGLPFGACEIRAEADGGQEDRLRGRHASLFRSAIGTSLASQAGESPLQRTRWAAGSG